VSVTAEPATSRHRILEAAITVIETCGEAGLRVDEIAEMAGVTQPSIYHVLAHRDGLISAAQADRRMAVGVLGIVSRWWFGLILGRHLVKPRSSSKPSSTSSTAPHRAHELSGETLIVGPVTPHTLGFRRLVPHRPRRHMRHWGVPAVKPTACRGDWK
jgi:hypothetical protein